MTTVKRSVFAISAMMAMSFGIASAQTPLNESMKVQKGYVGPRMDGKSMKWPDDLPANFLQGQEPKPVFLSACVDQGGVATSIDVQGSSGDKTLDKMAADMALQAHYQAAARDGLSMPVCGYTFEVQYVPKPADPAPSPGLK